MKAKYNYECRLCGKPVKTNLDVLHNDKLCHDCGRERRNVKRLLEDKGLMKLVNQLMTEAGMGETTPETLAKRIASKAEKLKQKLQEGKLDKVEYKCPECGGEGVFQFDSGSGASEIDKMVLKSLPACPECMMKKGMGGIAKLNQTTPGMPRTEGPIGPTPTIIDPDDIPPVTDKGNDEQSLSA